MEKQFLHRKEQILTGLTSSDRDASPKGSVDAEIQDLVTFINKLDGVVTTSSCAGRVSCYLEGDKTPTPAYENILTDENTSVSRAGSQLKRQVVASQGGKGAGGRWLYVSHTPVACQKHEDVSQLLFGTIPAKPYTLSVIQSNNTEQSKSMMLHDVHRYRFVRLKFEPVLLHILTASLETAQRVLTAAMNASLRESGIINVTSLPLVGIRTTGLSFDAPIGIYDDQSDVIYTLMPEDSLRLLIDLANARFGENKLRTDSFRTSLEHLFEEVPTSYWEPKDERAARLRRQGIEQHKLEVANKIPTQNSDQASLELSETFLQ